MCAAEFLVAQIIYLVWEYKLGRMSKMKTFSKKLKISALLAFLVLMLTSCSFSVLDDKDTLKVGMECSYAPFNWIQPNSKNEAERIAGGWYACGYDVYMAQEIAKKLGKKLEVVKIDWDGLLPALTSGKIDAIIAGMSATEERKKAIDFTDNYYSSDVVIVVKKSGRFSGAKSLKDFEGAKITGQLSTVHYDFIDQIPGVNKETALEDFSSMVAAVNAGKIDGYISEKPAALVAVHMNNSLECVEFEKGKGFEFSQDETAIAIGVKKGSHLREEINLALGEISEETRTNFMNKAIGGATF